MEILQRRSERSWWIGVHPDTALVACTQKKELEEKDGIDDPLAIAHVHQSPSTHSSGPSRPELFGLHSKLQTVGALTPTSHDKVQATVHCSSLVTEATYPSDGRHHLRVSTPSLVLLVAVLVTNSHSTNLITVIL